MNFVGKTIGNYIIIDSIGTGSFSRVYVAIHKLIQRPVAIKIVCKTYASDDFSKTRLMREITLMKEVTHPLIARFFELIEDETNFYIVMEYLEQGSLQDHIHLNGKMPEQKAKLIIAELVYAIFYLHTEKQIIHRDIKPENILLDKNSHIRQ